MSCRIPSHKTQERMYIRIYKICYLGGIVRLVKTDLKRANK